MAFNFILNYIKAERIINNILKNSVPISQKKKSHFVSTTNTNRLMQLKEAVVYPVNHTTVHSGGKTQNSLNVNANGACNSHCALND
jgi:hypothetical protein